MILLSFKTKRPRDGCRPKGPNFHHFWPSTRSADYNGRALVVAHTRARRDLMEELKPLKGLEAYAAHEWGNACRARRVGQRDRPECRGLALATRVGIFTHKVKYSSLWRSWHREGSLADVTRHSSQGMPGLFGALMLEMSGKIWAGRGAWGSRFHQKRVRWDVTYRPPKQLRRRSPGTSRKHTHTQRRQWNRADGSWPARASAGGESPRPRPPGAQHGRK